MSDIDDLTPEEALAESLVDEALAGMTIPASLLPQLRVTLICELLTTPEGLAKLRRAAADPAVSSSGSVTKPGAPKLKAAAQGAEPRKKRGPRGGGQS